MTETGVWQRSWSPAAATRPGMRARPRRAAGLWALLNAQALLNGPIEAAAQIEDNCHRLPGDRAARRPAPGAHYL